MTGQSLVSHAGLNVVTSFVDALGFRGLCEDRLGQFVPAGARHRPAGILGSLAVMLAGGGEHVSDLDILRAGIQRQERDCRALCARLGWQVAQV